MGIPIEEAIQQPTFQDEWHKALVNMLYTHNRLQDQLRKRLSSYGLTMPQYNVLRILRGARPHPLSTADIRDRMLDKSPDCSRLVDRLKTQGFAGRARRSADRRLVDVHITQPGLELLERIDRESPDMFNLMGRLTEAEAKQLNQLLDKVRTR